MRRSAFVFGNERLRSIETLGHSLLCQAGFLSRCNKNFAKRLVRRRMQGFGKSARLLSHQAAEHDPGFGLSQKWMWRRNRAMYGPGQTPMG